MVGTGDGHRSDDSWTGLGSATAGAGYGTVVLFDTWGQVGRVFLIGAMSYLLLILSLRVSGKRTLSKLNAFDFVVTVAIGSVLATILLSTEVSLAEGAAAFVVLVGGQFVVAFLSVRLATVRRLVKSTPTLLVTDGEVLDDRLRRHRVTDGEVRQAMRASGVGGFDQVAAVVLETDGTLSVIPHSRMGRGDALGDVRAPERESRHGSGS
jgi:uncharacterized membrane protein YcaP (DUF421 family)